jgi:hypothetical protein
LYYWVTFLQIRPWRDIDVCNVAPMAAGRRGFCNSGEAGGLGRAGTGRGGSRGVLGLVWVLGRAGGGSGERRAGGQWVRPPWDRFR